MRGAGARVRQSVLGHQTGRIRTMRRRLELITKLVVDIAVAITQGRMGRPVLLCDPSFSSFGSGVGNSGIIIAATNSSTKTAPIIGEATPCSLAKLRRGMDDGNGLKPS